MKITEVIPFKKENVVVFRIFNFSPSGYIVVSADDNTIPVLGYGLNSNFKKEDAPTALLHLLSGYGKEISVIIEEKIIADKNIESKWELYSSKEYVPLKSYSVGTHLLNTTWGQQQGYNRFCPADTSGTLSVVGCTAVALGQILYYWNCRVFPDGITSYTPPRVGYQLTVNFYEQSYYWNDMSLNFSDDYNAKLLYHCGVAIRVDYSSNGTSGSPYGVRDAMRYRFGIKNDGVAWRSSHISTWIDILKSDINADRPIYYRATDTTGIDNGHAWVIDGYDSNNKFHCNWGWYGNYQSNFYELGNLNPGLSHYTDDHGAILGAEPILDACSGLVGTTVVCSSNVSYSVTIPTLASVTWSKSGSLQQVGGNTSTTYTVKAATSSTSASGMVTATIRNSQGQIFLTRVKNVWVGKPTNNQIELGVFFTPPFDEVCIDQMMDIGVGSNTNAAAQGVFNYQWQFGSWDSYVMGYDDLHASNAIANIMLDAYAPATQIVGVSGENICGCDNNNPQSKTFYAVDCGGGWYMSMYPNPASDYVTVSFVVTDEVRSEEGKVMIEDKDYRDKELKEYIIEIWDEKRGVVKKVTSKEKYLQIPVNDLAPGRYYFHLIYNGQTYKQQLIVE